MSRRDCVFVTGGGSGIGMGLAGAFHAKGAKVVIGGRTRSKLEAVAARYPGMETEEMDVSDAASVTACAKRIAARHPDLSTLVNNAGIQQTVDFSEREAHDPALIAREIDINFKGLVLVSNAFLPLLKAQSAARLIHIGSGLAYVPLAAAPIYSATKAAVHSFTISLRRQLRETGITVIEIIPPVVRTELHAGQARQPPGAIPLDAFVAASMAGLKSGREEITVGRARVLKIASRLAPGLFLKIVNK